MVEERQSRTVVLGASYAHVNRCRHEYCDGKRLAVCGDMRDSPEFRRNQLVVVAAHCVALKTWKTVCSGVVTGWCSGCTRHLRRLLTPEGTPVDRGTGQQGDQYDDDGQTASEHVLMITHPLPPYRVAIIGPA